MTNDDLAKSVDTSDSWIFERTGIRQRHIAQKHETCAYMAIQAALAALTDANLRGYRRHHPRHQHPRPGFPGHCPARAGRHRGRGGGFDLAAACCGFIYALSVADSMTKSGQVRKERRPGDNLIRSNGARCRGGWVPGSLRPKRV